MEIATIFSEKTRSKALSSWTLLTSHGLVLLYVASNPDATIRQISLDVELTERRVADIISDLATAGLLAVHREGRRNHYTLNSEARFRHRLTSPMSFRDFVDLWQRSLQWGQHDDLDQQD